jgi:uncharacterized protein (DUF2336 family)
VVWQLAHHDEISIAGPVLAQSQRLATAELLEIAKTKSQVHLLAISGRSRLDEAVTDVLVERGDGQVVHKLATNSAAKFSQTGFAALAGRAQADVGLAERLMRRLDVPFEMLHALLSRATEAVRARLLSCVGAERRAERRLVLAKASKEIGQQATRDYTDARETIGAMQRQGSLNEAALLQFATYNRYEHVLAALPVLCGVSYKLIDHLMRNDRVDALLVP